MSYTESQAFEFDWQISENDETANMKRGDHGGLKTWVAGLPEKGEKRLLTKGDYAWTTYDRLEFQISLPEINTTGSKSSYELIAYFKDVDFWWYQKLLPYVLAPGDTMQIVVPFNGFSNHLIDKHQWMANGHMKPFDKSCLRKVREFGIVIFPSYTEVGEKQGTNNPHTAESVSSPGTFHISDFRLVRDVVQTDLSIYDFRAPSSGKLYERWEASFRLNKTYNNPFDPDEIDISAEFTSPSNKKHKVYGFWFQDYCRTPDGRFEKLRPIGDPMWKVRFAPMEQGEYTYTVSIKDKDGSFTTAPRSITVSDGDSDGFIRVSNKDYHYFEFDNGKFYWPITLNLHGLYDRRYVDMIRDNEIPIEDRKTYFYDDRFEKLAASGMNGTEIWMSSWGFELEWRGDWYGWAGLGQYNLQNAWRLDYIIRRAEELGIHINLVLECHGKFKKGSDNALTDSEWQHSPWNVDNGGWLKNDAATLTDERIFRSIEKRTRYILARYSHSPAIWSYEIMSESDLVPSGKSDTQRQFIWRYAGYVKWIDPYDHPVTNHYCGSYNNYDPVMFNNKSMDVASGDAYRGGVNKNNTVHFPSFSKHLVAGAKHLEQFKKPFVANECGGAWSGGPLFLLEADIHALNWAAFMTTFGGTPQTWWEDAVDENHWYEHYAAFAKYQNGEDKRAKGLVTYDEPVRDKNGKTLPKVFALSLRNDNQAYVWVYDDEEFSFGPARISDPDKKHHEVFNMSKLIPTRTVSGAVCTIPGLAHGKYNVEIWDTYTGEIIEKKEMNHAEDNLSVELPDFKKDIALKIKNTTVLSPEKAN